MFNDIKTVLAISPHTDDFELGAGGLVAKLCQTNIRVIAVAFSACEESVRDGFPKDVLRSEMREAGKVLGLNERDIITLSYPVRMFFRHRQSILDELLRLREYYNPDLILSPSLHDIHQDHKVVAEEVLRAFKNRRVLCYELPWNNLGFAPNLFCTLTEKYVLDKCEALCKYESQRHRQYFDPDVVRSRLIGNGLECGTRFVERFEVLRWVLS